MKKETKIRVFALIMALGMLFDCIVIGGPIVNAEGEGKPLSSLNKLLSTYNALPDGDGNVYEVYDGLKNVTIYDKEYESELLKACEFYPTGSTHSMTYSGKDTESFAASAGVKLSLSRNANIGLGKLLSISANRNFKISGDYAYNKSTEMYFYEFEATWFDEHATEG